MAKTPRVVAFTPDLARRIIKNSGGVNASQIHEWSRPAAAGSVSFRYYRLIEDAREVATWARLCDRVGTFLSTEWTKVHNWEGLLEGAAAGYMGLFVEIDSEWYFAQGPCIPELDAGAGSISLDAFPSGEVDSPYSFTIEFNDIAGELSAVGLPDGLSFDGETGEVTGTPTEEGVFGVIVSGLTTVDEESVTLTAAAQLTIAPAE